MRAPSQPRDRDRIDGHYLWEIEIAFYRKCGMGDEEAQFPDHYAVGGLG